MQRPFKPLLDTRYVSRKRSLENTNHSSLSDRPTIVDDVPRNNSKRINFVQDSAFFCEPCWRGYSTRDAYENHVALHVKCSFEGCNFKALPLQLAKHIIANHSDNKGVADICKTVKRGTRGPTVVSIPPGSEGRCPNKQLQLSAMSSAAKGILENDSSDEDSTCDSSEKSRENSLAKDDFSDEEGRLSDEENSDEEDVSLSDEEASVTRVSSNGKQTTIVEVSPSKEMPSVEVLSSEDETSFEETSSEDDTPLEETSSKRARLNEDVSKENEFKALGQWVKKAKDCPPERIHFEGSDCPFELANPGKKCCEQAVLLQCIRYVVDHMIKVKDGE